MDEILFDDAIIHVKSKLPFPDLSIVVPVHNKEKDGLLEKCLDSLVRQTHNNIEIVCVDDASDDGSLEILMRYASNHSNLSVVSMKTNSKQGAARNRGIRVARGDYIGFLDADDYVSEDFYESLLTKAKKTQASMIEGALQLVSFDGSNLGKASYSIPNDCIGDLNEERKSKLIMYHPPILCCIFASSLIKQRGMGFIEGMRYEDTPTLIRWIYQMTRTARSDSGCYYYRKNPDSTTSIAEMSIQSIKERLISSDCIISDAKEREVYTTYRDALDCYYMFVFLVNTLTNLSRKETLLSPREIRLICNHANKMVPRIYRNSFFCRLQYRDKARIMLARHLPVLFCEFLRAKKAVLGEPTA